jgi:NADH:ubiquinone reductase (H+-translocating)
VASDDVARVKLLPIAAMHAEPTGASPVLGGMLNSARGTAMQDIVHTAPSSGSPGSGLPKIVIVGAGFGGLEVAKGLQKAAAHLTVIDRHNYNLFQPLLYQVATAALSPADVAVPVRSLLRGANTDMLFDEVTGIDRASHLVTTRDGRRIGFDILVLATGSTYNYFGHRDWEAIAPSLKTLDDAVAIRRAVLLAFETAEGSEDETERKALLTFVLVGGGPTGVELAGAIAELAKATLVRDFRHIDPGAARIILVEAAPRILGAFPEKISRYAQSALEALGVEVATGAAIAAVDAAGVALAGGQRIEARTVIWCAGVEATPVGRWLGVETARNRAVKVTGELTLPGSPEIYVIGDAAIVQGSDGQPLPGLAAVAKQQGQYVARAVRARLQGKSTPPFRYRDYGTMATVGRMAAVADFGRVQVTGFLGWLLWGMVHINFLIGVRNRTTVFLNWVWAWFTYGRGARLITGDDRAIKSAAGIERRSKARETSLGE